MEHLGRFLYELEAGIQLFLCYRFWRMHRRDYPCFVAFTAFGVVSFIAMFLLYALASRQVYAYAYWRERSLQTLFLALVAAELLNGRFRPIAAILGLAILGAQFVQFRIWLDTVATLTMALPLLFLLWRGDERELQWWIAAGFVTYAVSTALVQHQVGRSEFRYVGTCCYLLAQVLWTRGLFLPSPNRRPHPPRALLHRP